MIASRSNLKPTYNAFTRQIRASIAMDYEQWCNTNCDQLEHYQNTHQMRIHHQKIKELTNGVAIKERNIAIKDKNGVLLTIESDVRKRWSEYCKELYNHNINADNTALASL